MADNKSKYKNNHIKCKGTKHSNKNVETDWKLARPNYTLSAEMHIKYKNTNKSNQEAVKKYTM